jgi:nucleoside-diphosphate-sugar epimerase
LKCPSAAASGACSFWEAAAFTPSSPSSQEALLTGALEPTNEWYAIAKISGIKLCEALRAQHGFDAISLQARPSAYVQHSRIEAVNHQSV